MTTRVKAGIDVEVYREIMSFLIQDHEAKDRLNGGHGPICCFYTCGPKEIPKYARNDSFRNCAGPETKAVMGCSRGCVAHEDLENDIRVYSRKLCRECVEEARRLVER